MRRAVHGGGDGGALGLGVDVQLGVDRPTVFRALTRPLAEADAAATAPDASWEAPYLTSNNVCRVLYVLNERQKVISGNINSKSKLKAQKMQEQWQLLGNYWVYNFPIFIVIEASDCWV